MAINSETIVKLREKTGLGMMACKKALEDSNGDIEVAIDNLRKKGAIKAQERADRSTDEGVVVSYIHSNNKIGAIVELNCETDFVARNSEFIDFAKSLAMQITAMNPVVVSPDDVSSEDVAKETLIYEAQLANEGKTGEMAKKILEGKIKKFREQSALLKQAYIKDQSKLVEDVLLDINNKMGENIKVRRFTRFQLGGI